MDHGEEATNTTRELVGNASNTNTEEVAQQERDNSNEEEIIPGHGEEAYDDLTWEVQTVWEVDVQTR